MFRSKNKELDTKSLNEVIKLTKNILVILFVLAVIACIYIFTIVCKEWKILEFIFRLIAIISPLFVGILIAWLFDPFVKMLNKKGIRRSIGTLISYVLFLGTLTLILGTMLPLLYEQINEFVKIVPELTAWMQNIFDGILESVDNLNIIDVDKLQENIFDKIGELTGSIIKELPDKTITFITALASSIGTFFIGLIIGFYLLISFDNVNDTLITMIPKKFRDNADRLMNKSNHSLRKWVQGALFESTIVFVASSLLFYIVGLKASMLFGLFCGLTNVIPYAGPYIGGIPAVIVGFSQSPGVGILTLVIVAGIQFIEGNFLQPFIMSKTTKLHPVTIMLGLLIFGHFFGIIGMVISTPVISLMKVLVEFIKELYIEIGDKEK